MGMGTTILYSAYKDRLAKGGAKIISEVDYGEGKSYFIIEHPSIPDGHHGHFSTVFHGPEDVTFWVADEHV